jgi:hypothetical protein
MEHVLIVGGDRAALDTLEENLWGAGHRSIIAARDAGEAWATLRALHPELIVVVPGAAPRIARDELYRMSETSGAPIIVATADPAEALRCLGPGVTLEGPYPADALARADAASRRPARHLAHAA